jgi:hypothetical protein
MRSCSVMVHDLVLQVPGVELAAQHRRQPLADARVQPRLIAVDLLAGSKSPSPPPTASPPARHPAARRVGTVGRPEPKVG